MRRLSGVVVDESGQPLSRLNVCVVPEGATDDMTRLGYATTDSDGLFSLASLVPDPLDDSGRSNGPGIEVLDSTLHRLYRTDQIDLEAPIRLVIPARALSTPPPHPESAGRAALAEAVRQLTIRPERPAIPLGSRVGLVAVASNRDRHTVGGLSITWSASDERGDEVPISPAGELNGLAPGRFTVRASVGRHFATTVVTVHDGVSADRRSRTAAPLAPDVETGPRWNSENAAAAFDPDNQVGARSPALTVVRRRAGRSADQERIREEAMVGSANYLFSVPIIDLPGRGIGLRLDLTYNSRLWTRRQNVVEFDTDDGWPAPGWSLGFGRMVRLGSLGSMLIGPDGTRHPYETVRYSEGPAGVTFAGRTSDASFIDYLQNGNQAAGYGRAYHPDGTIVEYNARGAYGWNAARTSFAPGAWIVFPTRIIDANGNTLTITYRNNAGPEIDTITDTLGRCVTFHYDAEGLPTAVTGPGLNGTDRTLLRFNFGRRALAHQFSGLRAVVPESAPVVLRAMYFPGDRTGYWFGDDDTYSDYGMACRISRHRDMGFDGAPLSQPGVISPGVPILERRYNYPPAADPGLADVPAYTQLTETWEGMDTGPAITQFSLRNVDDQREITTMYPDGARVVTRTHRRPPPPDDATPSRYYDDGLPFERNTYDGERLVRSERSHWERGDWNSARLRRTEVLEAGVEALAAAVEYRYGGYNSVTEVIEYGFGGGHVLRRTLTQYRRDAGYLARHLLHLPSDVQIFSGTDPAPVSRTEYDYDSQPLQDTPGVVSHSLSHNPYAPDIVVPPHDERICDEERKPPCITEHTDGYTYNPYQPGTARRGNITEIRRYADPAGPGGAIIERRRYDITGNVVITQRGRFDQIASEFTSATQFSAPGRTLRGSGAAEMIASAVYDTGTGLPVQTIDENGRAFTLAYHVGTLRPVSLGWPSGATITTVYDDSSRTATTTTRQNDGSLTAERSTTRNGLGLVRRTTDLAGFAPGEGGPLQDITEVRFDARGRQTGQTVPYRVGEAPEWIRFELDVLGRITRRVLPDGSEITYDYQGAARPEPLMPFDPSVIGRTVLQTDPWGRQLFTAYNALGQLTSVVEPAPDGDGSVMIPQAGLTTYSYDPLNHVTQMDLSRPGTTGQQRRFGYDGLGRLTHQSVPERDQTLTDDGTYRGESALWSEVTAYDDTRMAWQVDARGVRTRYDHEGDPLGRTRRVAYELLPVPDGAPDRSAALEPASSVTYEYASSGDLSRLASITTDLMTEHYDYDDQGRLGQMSLVLVQAPDTPLQLTYHYDGVDRIRAVQHPARYATPGDLRPEVEIERDQAGRIARLRLDGHDELASATYLAAGQPVSLVTSPSDPIPVIEEYDRGPLPGLIGGQRVRRGEEVLLELTHNYLRAGQPGVSGELVSTSDALHPDQSVTYEYDMAGRIRRELAGDAESPSWSQQYSYDAFGNRIGVDAAGHRPDGDPIEADGLSGLTCVQLVGDGLASIRNRFTTDGYMYDEAGNLLRAQQEAGGWLRFRYDLAGRLVSVHKDDGTPLETYLYRSCRRRLATRNETTRVLTVHVWQEEQVVAEYRARENGLAWEQTNVYAGQRLLSVYQRGVQIGPIATGDRIRVHHPDNRGTRLITVPDASSDHSRAVEENATLPFGRSISPPSGINRRTVFTNYDRSPLTGLDYAVNRTYAPDLGRFLESDPLGGAAMTFLQPESANTFAYCGSDPINLRDPSGLRWNQVPGGCVQAGDMPWSCSWDFVWSPDWLDNDTTDDLATGIERLVGDRRGRDISLGDGRSRSISLLRATSASEHVISGLSLTGTAGNADGIIQLAAALGLLKFAAVNVMGQFTVAGIETILVPFRIWDAVAGSHLTSSLPPWGGRISFLVDPPVLEVRPPFGLFTAFQQAMNAGYRHEWETLTGHGH